MAIIDSYSESNAETGYALNSGGNIYFGQSIVPSSTVTVGSCKFYIQKYGSPTGDIVASIYASSGTHGTDAVPSGAALAVSDAVSAASLTAYPNYSLTTFTFSGANQISLTSDTCYILVISYPGGDSNNKIFCSHDVSTPTHAGNALYYSTFWTALTSRDMIFYLETTPDPGNSLSVFDAAQVAESVELNLSDCNCSVIDLVGYTEFISNEIISILELSTSDAISVSENIIAEQGNEIVDSVSISEECSLIVDPLHVITDDLIIIEEYVDRNALVILLDEGITVIDVATVYVVEVDITVLAVDSVNLSENIFKLFYATALSIRTIPPVHAPTASLSAAMGQRFELDSKSPVAFGAGSFGSVFAEKAPVAVGEGSISFAEILELNTKAPVSSCEGVFGASAEGFASTASCYSESLVTWMGVNGLAPISGLVGSLYEESVLNLSAQSPFPFLEAEMYSSGMVVQGIAPVWSSWEINLLEIGNGVMVSFAPVVMMEYGVSNLTYNGMQVNGIAPVGVMQSTGGSQGEQAEIVDYDRFDDYTLEYVR